MHSSEFKALAFHADAQATVITGMVEDVKSNTLIHRTGALILLEDDGTFRFTRFVCTLKASAEVAGHDPDNWNVDFYSGRHALDVEKAYRLMSEYVHDRAAVEADMKARERESYRKNSDGSVTLITETGGEHTYDPESIGTLGTWRNDA